MIKELSKSNQTRYGVSHVYVECKTKRIFGIACLGKKVSISYGNFLLFRISNLENRSFSYGQKLLEIEPNSA